MCHYKHKNRLLTLPTDVEPVYFCHYNSSREWSGRCKWIQSCSFLLYHPGYCAAAASSALLSQASRRSKLSGYQTAILFLTYLSFSSDHASWSGQVLRPTIWKSRRLITDMCVWFQDLSLDICWHRHNTRISAFNTFHHHSSEDCLNLMLQWVHTNSNKKTGTTKKCNQWLIQYLCYILCLRFHYYILTSDCGIWIGTWISDISLISD